MNLSPKLIALVTCGAAILGLLALWPEDPHPTSASTGDVARSDGATRTDGNAHKVDTDFERQVDAPDSRPSIVGHNEASSPPDEHTLMRQLRALMFSEPKISLQLAREGNQTFEGSADSAERRWFEVRALVQLGRIDEARGVAQSMVDRYPETRFAVDVRRHLLSHAPDAPVDQP